MTTEEAIKILKYMRRAFKRKSKDAIFDCFTDCAEEIRAKAAEQAEALGIAIKTLEGK